MSVEDGSAWMGNVGTQPPVVRRIAGHREEAPGVCSRSGSPILVRTTERPARWRSQRCRRAAYEDRRAAAAGGR